uniref:Uncharacterized protein LOC104216034 n=1 Tax=Nicotiana sylvestris TaxID=4096 RepID=A0A1U7VQZ0_NICSY|nr:PREDICTED: uncharacterized protein LOC104216034 [Nicotiana sylvestris]
MPLLRSWATAPLPLLRLANRRWREHALPEETDKHQYHPLRESETVDAVVVEVVVEAELPGQHLAIHQSSGGPSLDLSVCTVLAQAVSATTRVATLQAGETPEAPPVQQVAPVQPVSPVQDFVVPAMPDDELRCFERFSRLSPPTFGGAQGEDAQGFLDKCRRMLRTAGILESSGEFSTLFLEKCVPRSQREELRRQFEYLRQGDMTVTQYEVRFLELARYAPWMVPTDRERIRRFVDGLIYPICILMTQERVLSHTFEDAVDIARDIETARLQVREEREAKRPRGSGSFSGTPSRGRVQQSIGRSFRPHQLVSSRVSWGIFRPWSSGVPAGPVFNECPPSTEFIICSLAQGSSVLSVSAGHSSAMGSLQSPAPTPAPTQSARGGVQVARGGPRGGGRTGGGQARFYALPDRRDAIASDDPSIDYVPVVRDFPDVFPADLAGMPPDRDINFGIDLVPGTKPISIPPYRFDLVKVKDFGVNDSVLMGQASLNKAVPQMRLGGRKSGPEGLGDFRRSGGVSTKAEVADANLDRRSGLGILGETAEAVGEPQKR